MSPPPGPAIGARVKALRAQRGLSVVDLARLSGLNQETIRELERGAKRQPARATLARLALAFACRLEELEGAPA